ncbi:hypothetical protein SEA_LATERM_57 [Mycobacterium phage LaterM]|uniref:Uncharacterized protein n=1 Tax=Mycobacterium phage LaterM TaxID=2094136 RepID=A0A2P1JYZ5_9CAUD|nr:hypothetical protein I5H00_gp44 [Mycobacterium phage LaterM]AVO25570.1 hypothetical protein SEA_LATERM_57 [Mycobacterium phage LaterM]WNO27539.1 hypothetical protein SEA_AGEOFDAPAGE_59 [Mycobacterium phage Ageofdapage]
MKVSETHHTTITVEPGDKVRDLYAVLDEMPNGAEISVYAPLPMFNTDPTVNQYAGVISVDHLSIEG